MSTDFASDNSFDFDDVDADKPGTAGGGGRLPEGAYAFGITEVELKNDRGSTRVECEVIAAKDKNLVGRKHTEYLKWPDKQHGDTYDRIAKEQMLAWCYATKTTSAEVIKARQAARQGFDSAWLEQMVGRQCIGYVKAETYDVKDANGKPTGEKKTSTKVDGRVWSPDNPKAERSMKELGLAVPAAPPATQSPAAPPAQNDPFGGLI